MNTHRFDNHVDGVTYCSQCGIWEGAASATCSKPSPRDLLVAEIVKAGKAWHPMIILDVSRHRPRHLVLAFMAGLSQAAGLSARCYVDELMAVLLSERPQAKGESR